MHSLADMSEELTQTRRGGRRVIDEAEVFHKKYRKQMNELDQYSILSKVRSITPLTSGAN